MQHDLKAILDDFESDLERICDIASARFTLAVQAKCAEWKERYPRHDFNAWEGHGRMSIDVHPPINGDYQLSLMNPDGQRGAIAQLISEAAALVDACNESERRVGMMLDKEIKTKGWPK